VSRFGLLSLAAVLVLAGCSGSVGSSPTIAPETPLAAGQHGSTVFQPAVTFTVPDGWVLADDSASYLQVRPADQDTLGIHLFRDAKAASQDPSCPVTPAPGVGTSSVELLAWLRGLDGLVVTPPALVTVGGLRGSSVDIAIKSGWTASCPFANGLPTVPLLVEEGIGLRWVMAGGERLRLYLLDLPSGGTVLIDVDDFVGDQLSAFLGVAVPVVTSMTFAQ
jgi:hypothetical protein